MAPRPSRSAWSWIVTASPAPGSRRVWTSLFTWPSCCPHAPRPWRSSWAWNTIPTRRSAPAIPASPAPPPSSWCASASPIGSPAARHRRNGYRDVSGTLAAFVRRWRGLTALAARICWRRVQRFASQFLSFDVARGPLRVLGRRQRAGLLGGGLGYLDRLLASFQHARQPNHPPPRRTPEGAAALSVRERGQQQRPGGQRGAHRKLAQRRQEVALGAPECQQHRLSPVHALQRDQPLPHVDDKHKNTKQARGRAGVAE